MWSWFSHVFLQCTPFCVWRRCCICLVILGPGYLWQGEADRRLIWV
jgi:hypothetical protein